MSRPLDEGQRQTLLFAPLWVYTAVAGADGPPEPSQFRRFLEELDAADARLAQSDDARAALGGLRDNLDATFEAYQADRTDPRGGLRRLRGVLKRLAENDAAAVTGWLLDLSVRIGGARHIAGDAHISENEWRAIHDVASWLGVEPPAPPSPTE